LAVDSATPVNIGAGNPHGLVTLLDGESFNQASPTGKTGTPAIMTAGVPLV